MTRHGATRTRSEKKGRKGRARFATFLFIFFGKKKEKEKKIIPNDWVPSVLDLEQLMCSSWMPWTCPCSAEERLRRSLEEHDWANQGAGATGVGYEMKS